MIKSVGQATNAAIEAAKLRESAQTRAPARAAPVPNAVVEQAIANPAARLAAEGAPIDLDKIGRIKQAIASGNYPVDADSIAEKMLALDLPVSFN